MDNTVVILDVDSGETLYVTPERQEQTLRQVDDYRLDQYIRIVFRSVDEYPDTVAAVSSELYDLICRAMARAFTEGGQLAYEQEAEDG